MKKAVRVDETLQNGGRVTNLLEMRFRIAEETFAKAHGQCKPAKEYTSRYRCVHVMVGNDKMTAQLDGVCLLRKRELSLQNGFSYDLFMDMIKTLRFKDE